MIEVDRYGCFAPHETRTIVPRESLGWQRQEGFEVTRYDLDDWLPRTQGPTSSGLPGIAFGTTQQIAVLDASKSTRDYACELIRTMGHEALEFMRTEDLVSALMVGTRFDMVLASFNGDQEATLTGVRTLRRALGMAMPVLLMMQPAQLQRADSFYMDPAVDFVMLPCEECEMVARITASMKAAEARASARLSFGRYHFEPQDYSVRFGEHCVPLKPKEFGLALLLFRNAGKTLSREMIFRTVWRGTERELAGRTIDVHIAHIRRKLMLNPGDVARLSSVYGMGYLLRFEDRRVMNAHNAH